MRRDVVDPTPKDAIEVMAALAFALGVGMTQARRQRTLEALEALAGRAEMQSKLRVMAGIQQLAQAVKVAEQSSGASDTTAPKPPPSS